MNSNNSSNVQTFAEELSKIVGQPITLNHIHEGTGRYYYIQQTKENAPMILHHYRGPFFVDMNPKDLNAIKNGEIDAVEYIKGANWQIGYYWGGGSMVGGGFYQPFDIVGHSDEVKRYFKILSCRGHRVSSGYMPSEEQCAKCDIKNCPFSQYGNGGDWSSEIQEFDPRKDFFHALMIRFEKEYAGYTLRGFLCGNIPDDQIWISSNFHYGDAPYSFTAYASENVIRSLLMHEVEPEDWNEYAEKFTFVHSEFGDDTHNPVTLDQIVKIFDKANQEKEAFVVRVDDDYEVPMRKKSFFARLVKFFKK